MDDEEERREKKERRRKTAVVGGVPDPVFYCTYYPLPQLPYLIQFGQS